MTKKKKEKPPMTLTDQVRAEIEATGKTGYAIAKAAGVKPETVYRFMARERDLQGASLNKLCAVLGLELKKKGE
jgi:transcriptional regulator with XRE-family HTH domain